MFKIVLGLVLQEIRELRQKFAWRRFLRQFSWEQQESERWWSRIEQREKLTYSAVATRIQFCGELWAGLSVQRYFSFRYGARSLYLREPCSLIIFPLVKLAYEDSYRWAGWCSPARSLLLWGYSVFWALLWSMVGRHLFFSLNLMCALQGPAIPSLYRLQQLLLLLSRLVMSDSVWPHRGQPTRLPRPWDSPGKNTGVGCHFLLQCMKVKSQSEVAQSCLTAVLAFSFHVQ